MLMLRKRKKRRGRGRERRRRRRKGKNIDCRRAKIGLALPSIYPLSLELEYLHIITSAWSTQPIVCLPPTQTHLDVHAVISVCVCGTSCNPSIATRVFFQHKIHINAHTKVKCYTKKWSFSKWTYVCPKVLSLACWLLGDDGALFWVQRSSGSAPHGSPRISPCSKIESKVWSRFKIAPNISGYRHDKTLHNSLWHDH